MTVVNKIIFCLEFENQQYVKEITKEKDRVDGKTIFTKRYDSLSWIHKA